MSKRRGYSPEVIHPKGLARAPGVRRRLTLLH